MGGDFPGGPVVKNPPGDVGSIPSWETKIPHAVVQLSLCTLESMPQLESPCATTTEPARSGAFMAQLESPHTTTAEPVHSGAHVLQILSPCATTREKPMRCNEYTARCKERSRMPQ